MIINVDTNDLNVAKLSLNGFFICKTVMENRKDELLSYIENQGKFDLSEINKLQENGWIKNDKKNEKILFENLEIEEKFRIFVEKRTSSLEKVDWVNEWFDIFPKGIKSGGYYVKSDISGCRKKLMKFLIKFPEYNKEIIMKATTNYVESCSKKGYQYMKIAPYFIEKDGVSMLAGECEAIRDNIEDYDNKFIEQI